ncbi:MAG: response regulator transcription factor, partial [Streptosporangiaceae bacterium]
MSGQPIRVIVVDDEPMVCAHLTTILGATPDIEAVDQAHDGAAAVEAVVRHKPDLVLMDLRMPGVDGIAAIERITMLRQPPCDRGADHLRRGSACAEGSAGGRGGSLLKSTPPEDLTELVRVAAN